MAKGAATEGKLGGLHDRLTDVFIRVLKRYEDRMGAMERFNAGELEGDMLEELFEDGAMPNPAMLGAITKFLKDNEISFDTEKVGELNSLERRLAEQRKNRANVVSLTTLPRAADG